MAEILERRSGRHVGVPRTMKYMLAPPVLVFALFMIWSGMNAPAGKPNAESVLLQSKITPSPQVASGEALKALRATEDAVLTTYGWVDKSKGIVHIPIDRAMDLLLQRGLPTRAPQQARLEF
jgi:hypothetical protein